MFQVGFQVGSRIGTRDILFPYNIKISTFYEEVLTFAELQLADEMLLVVRSQACKVAISLEITFPLWNFKILTAISRHPIIKIELLNISFLWYTFQRKDKSIKQKLCGIYRPPNLCISKIVYSAVLNNWTASVQCAGERVQVLIATVLGTKVSQHHRVTPTLTVTYISMCPFLVREISDLLYVYTKCVYIGLWQMNILLVLCYKNLK